METKWVSETLDCSLAYNVCQRQRIFICVFYITNEMQLIQCSLLLSELYMFRGGFSAYHQELIKLYVQPWVLSCFSAVYRWCGCVPTHPHLGYCHDFLLSTAGVVGLEHIHTSGRQRESITILKAAHTVL